MEMREQLKELEFKVEYHDDEADVVMTFNLNDEDLDLIIPLVRADMQREIIPPRYAPIKDFIDTMIAKMEAVTPRYGDWWEADIMQLWRHFFEEQDEWNENCQDHKEIIDMVNCLFMMWCYWKKPASYEALKSGTFKEGE